MENTRNLIILRGLPGSGKTTFAEFLQSVLGQQSEEDVVSVAADDFFTDPESGEYNFDATKLGAAHCWCQRVVAEAMAVMTPYIVVHNTSTMEKEVKSYMDLADLHGYRVVSLVVENRHEGTNVHNVPDEALSRMRDRFSVRL